MHKTSGFHPYWEQQSVWPKGINRTEDLKHPHHSLLPWNRESALWRTCHNHQSHATSPTCDLTLNLTFGRLLTFLALPSTTETHSPLPLSESFLVGFPPSPVFPPKLSWKPCVCPFLKSRCSSISVPASPSLWWLHLFLQFEPYSLCWWY